MISSEKIEIGGNEQMKNKNLVLKSHRKFKKKKRNNNYNNSNNIMKVV